MFEVTEKATGVIMDFMKDKEETSSIRIFLSRGGWSGPSLGLALDEPREDDEVIKDNGVTYIINKELYEQAQPIHVDFVESAMGSGFYVNSNLRDSKDCGGSCATSCSC